MTTIYLDESGYTGEDLINADQPYFVIASSIIGDAEAKEILERCFPRYQGGEFKFSNIWKRGTHRQGLKALAAEIPGFADRAFIWIIDKRFCLLTKMIDYLVEPPMRAAGFDFYKDGYALRYLNTCHRDILEHGSDALYTETVALWDRFARAPGEENLAALEAHLRHIAATTRPPLSSLYDFALKGLVFFRASNPDLSEFTESNEIQLTSVFSTIVRWRQMRREDFDLVHDESGNFLRQRSMWDTMLRDDFVAPPIPQGNGTEVQFPLRVRSTTPMSSHASHAVQLCDVLAGLGAKVALAFEGREQDPFTVELVRLGAGELTHGGVMPHALYAYGPPPRADGPDVVDRMIELIEPELLRRGLGKTKS